MIPVADMNRKPEKGNSEEAEVVDEMDKGGKPVSTCNFCPKPKVLKNADAVRQHQDMKHKDAKFRCSYKRCQLRFYSKIDRKNQEDCHLWVNSKKCRACGLLL